MHVGYKDWILIEIGRRTPKIPEIRILRSVHTEYERYMWNTDENSTNDPWDKNPSWTYNNKHIIEDKK